MIGAAAAGQRQPFTPFGRSHWRTPLSPTAPVDPESAAKVAHLLDVSAQIWPGPNGEPAWTLATTGDTPHMVTVDHSTGTQPLSIRLTQAEMGGAWGQRLAAQFAEAVVPADFTMPGSSGTDEFVAVYDRRTDTYWDGWHTRYDVPGWPGWSVERGQRITGTETKDGVAEIYDGQFIYGSTASALDQWGGTILPSELQAGLIPHALFCSVPVSCVAPGTVWPALRTDGASTHPGAITMGQRLRLPASLDVDSLGLSPVAKTLARAFRDYGAIVGDRTGGDTNFRCKHQAGDSSLYSGALGADDRFNYAWDRGGHEAFPFQLLQVV